MAVACLDCHGVLRRRSEARLSPACFDTPRPELFATAAIAVIAGVTTLLWSAAVHNYVFPINPDLRVNPAGQIAQIKDHPFGFSTVLARSLISEAPRGGLMLIGARLSAMSVHTPKVLVIFSGLVLILATLTSGNEDSSFRLRMFVLALIVIGACAPFPLLYIQNTIVAAPRVDGYQARYFIPVLPYFALVLPAFDVRRLIEEARLRLAVGLGGTLAMIGLTSFLALRTWI